MDPDAFWQSFCDDEEIADFFLRGLGFSKFDILVRDEDCRSIRRTVECDSQVRLPRAIAAVVGPTFRYVESGVFDKRTRSWSFVWTPSAFEERILLEGRMWTEARPAEPDSCDRNAEMTVAARFPAIGSYLERLTARFLQGQWDRSAAMMNRWLAARRVS